MQIIPIPTSALTRATGYYSVETRRFELPLERRLNLAVLLEPLSLLLLNALALLGFFFLLPLLPSAAERLAVVRLPPLPEGVGVDLHDGGLGQGVGAHEFVVRGVEGDADNADFAGDPLAAPCKVTGIETERTWKRWAKGLPHVLDTRMLTHVRNLRLPPRVRTRWILFAPIRVLAG